MNVEEGFAIVAKTLAFARNDRRDSLNKEWVNNRLRVKLDGEKI